MDKQRILIFVGAHPDDETFGVVATLAQYAASGVKVYYLCSTRGEAGTVDPEFLKGYNSIGDLRWDELTRAAKLLGLSGVFHLGYRDSGMRGTEDNKYPDALINAPVEEAAGRIVKLFRQIKPDVVITHDPSGGYGHVDHVATHNAAVMAIKLAGDPLRYPEAGPAFQPQKLYCAVRSNRFLKGTIKLMPLFGQNPRKYGRNKDIDLVKMMENEYPIHTSIRLKKEYLKIRDEAAACHASQGGGRPQRGILAWLMQRFRQDDIFMRAYPQPERGYIEKDLFEGVRLDS